VEPLLLVVVVVVMMTRLLLLLILRGPTSSCDRGGCEKTRAKLFVPKNRMDQLSSATAALSVGQTPPAAPAEGVAAESAPAAAAAAAPAADAAPASAAAAKPVTLDEAQAAVSAAVDAGRGPALEVRTEFANLKVEPKVAEGEDRDANFPRNLHNACQLFVMAKMVPNAQRCAAAIGSFLGLVAAPPDGRSSCAVGRAAVCWGCGYVGLPLNRDTAAKVGYRGEHPICGGEGCAGGFAQTNWVRPERAAGEAMPWFQPGPPGALAPGAVAEAAAADWARRRKAGTESGAAAAAAAAGGGGSGGSGGGGGGGKGGAPKRSKRVKPNDPCPCGSGKKYKKCCGAA